MYRRRFVVGTGITSVGGLAGCTETTDDDGNSNDATDVENGGEADGTTGESDTDSDDDGDTDRTEETDTEAPIEQSFEGNGTDLVSGVRTDEGFAITEASHDGGGTFRAVLTDDTTPADVLVDESGRWSGSSAALVDGGDRNLEIEAGGEWALTLSQPRPDAGDPLPAAATGTGPDVDGPYEFTGAHIMSASHGGESNFQVQVFPLVDDTPELVVNTIGEHDDEAEFTFVGIGFVAVTADGDWSIEIETS